MMRCPNCGLELADSALAVCPRCGYALAASPPHAGGSDSPFAAWGAPPTDPSATQGMPTGPGYPGYGAPMPPPYGVPPSAPLGGPPNPYQSGPYRPQPGPYGAPPSQPLAPGQTAPGGWPPPPPGFGMPGQPSGYAPYGQPAPPSWPLAPGQTYPGYPGGVPQPPKPAKRGMPAAVGALVAVIVVAAALVGLYVWGMSGTSSPATHGGPGTPGTSGAAGTSTATAGASPTATRGATTGSVIYADSLGGGAAKNWPNDSHCGPTSAGYRVAPSIICFAPIDDLGDGSVTVDAMQSSGPTNQAYGLVVRRASEGNYYLFGIDGNGKWVFAKCTSTENSCEALQDFTASAAIQKGLNVKNTLSIQMSGVHFTFTINGTQVGQVDDASFASGWTGLASGDNLEALFQNITITK